MSRDLRALVTRLTDEIDGLGVDDFSEADLLDALASAGITLAEDTNGETAKAYQEVINDR